MKLKTSFLSSFNSFLLLTFLLASFHSYGQTPTEKKAERWFEIEVILFKQLGNKDQIKEQFPEHINRKSETENNSKNETDKSSKNEDFFDLLTPYLQSGQSSQSNLDNIQQSLPQCSQKTSNSAELPSSKDVALELEETDLDVGLDAEKAKVNINCFGVSELPAKLNASGNHNSTAPYLINNNSLRLKNINKKLLQAKEFEPLLHFGWRQVGITKNKAIALKLFAGESLEYAYQQANKDYQVKLVEAQLAKEQYPDANSLNGNITEQASVEPLQTSTTILEKTQVELDNDTRLKQQELQLLFDEYNKLSQENTVVSNDSITAVNNKGTKVSDESSVSDERVLAIITELEQQTLSSLLADQSTDNNSSDKTQPFDGKKLSTKTPQMPPLKPLQPWFLDGFFKVHLDHYLYITADFNLFNDSELALQSITGDYDINKDDTNEAGTNKEKSKNFKLINFSQNRRVITGEIHYFDHPYIGMIVQIRRFDPTKPPNEAVTQARNN